MNSHKINNSNLRMKVIIRLTNLPDKEKINILDLFHGNGVVWKNVQRNTKKKLIVHGIDLQKYDDELSLIGDNMKIIKRLDLKKYDIIDFDAWGLPDKQIAECVPLAMKGTIFFYTFIQSFNGALSNYMLNRIGITETMIKKCRTIFNRGGHKYFICFLACNKIKSVVYLNNRRKHYGCFKKEE